MNKSQQIATITLAAAKMALAVEAKALEINVPVVFPWWITVGIRC